jgi:F0F1-type ATP synthase assembly protein I
MGQQLVRLLALQGAITMVVAGGIFVWGNSLAGMAALMGGGAAAVAASAYGAAYWASGAGRSGKLLRGFLVAELCRVGVALVLLWLGFVSLPGEAAIAFLGAFAAALMAYLLVFLF